MLRLKFFLLIFIVTSCCFTSSAQQIKAFSIKGFILDDNDLPISGVSVTVLNKNTGVVSNDSGYFNIKFSAAQSVALVFSHSGYNTLRKIIATKNRVDSLTIHLERNVTSLNDVILKDERVRREVGRIEINPDRAVVNPSPISGIESLLKIFVGSSNELTSQYSVRGGSYDENLIYVNDFEVFRPYLIKSGQQEGLSFINPELTGNVKFYNGGFQSKYGDKMSSVLDIAYRKPKQFGGSAYLGLLEQGLHVEGVSDNKKFTYLFGVRNRSNKNLLSSQTTKGNYIPSSSDLQSLITWQCSKKWQLELFANFSTTKFELYPEEAKLTSSVFTPLYTTNIGLDIYFQGQEKDAYQTNFLGFAATNQVSKKLRLKWLVSHFNNNESENVDITGAYLFGDRDFNNSSSTYGSIVNPLGAGAYQNFSRNTLDITVWNASHKGTLDMGKQVLSWGNSFDYQTINDKINEWKYTDSAGYSLPYSTKDFNFSEVVKSKNDLNLFRLSGYVQDNIQFKDSSDVTMQVGLRYNYNNLNKELFFSPRAGLSYKPKHWKKDVIIKMSAGLYYQPPFYREMRKKDGTLNEDLKAQKSWQVSGGFDYNFKLNNRPARLSTEVYYKNQWDVVPYDVNNVSLQYFGTNSAKAFAAGFETRLYTELVKDAESWVSFGVMNTMEKLDNFYYYKYYNKEHEEISSTTTDNIIADSTKNNVGWIRRPTDRRLTLGLFLQDYLTTNKNFKVYFNTLYGSNMPYNVPEKPKYRNALIIEPYIRVDIGFSALLLDKETGPHRSHSPFKNFESIWASLEVFNLIDRQNTISYMMIKDFQNNTFAMPNRLTPRMLNLKLVVRW